MPADLKSGACRAKNLEDRKDDGMDDLTLLSHGRIVEFLGNIFILPVSLLLKDPLKLRRAAVSH